MTKKTVPSFDLPKSVTSTMLGWAIRLAARASRRKRLIDSSRPP